MKKLLLATLLLLSIFASGQKKSTINIFYTHHTLNLNGVDIIGDFNKHEIGFGFSLNEQNRIMYIVAGKKITNDFSICGKLGQYYKDSIIYNENVTDTNTYYGILATLKPFDNFGLKVSFGFDNTQNCMYGIGYNF